MVQKIAITGGIGSGKSCVLEEIKKHGYEGFSCDEIYKEVIRQKEYVEKIKDVFPSVVKNGKDGEGIDRKELSRIVFQDEEALKQLNEIAHPLIMSALERKMNAAQGEYVFAEVPLLFEGNYQDIFDRVIVVLRDKKLRIEAIVRRDGVETREAELRIERQFDYEKNAVALSKRYFIFENNYGIDELKKWVDEWIKAVCK